MREGGRKEGGGGVTRGGGGCRRLGVRIVGSKGFLQYLYAAHSWAVAGRRAASGWRKNRVVPCAGSPRRGCGPGPV
jgi:hypothetical protein